VKAFVRVDDKKELINPPRTLFAVGSERTNAHLHIKMGFANVWGSHPKDNAKGGRAWYAGDVLFPNETREIFFSLFCAFFFFCAAAETP
jgi:hypothetical protein